MGKSDVVTRDGILYWIGGFCLHPAIWWYLLNKNIAYLLNI